MSILQQIKETVGSVDRRKIVIEGPGGSPVTLFATPVSMADIDRAKRKNDDMSSGDFMAEIVILVCQLEDGSKAFTLEDKAGLIRLPAGILLSIFNQVFNVASIEDHAKN
jgi:hypothetical protein